MSFFTLLYLLEYFKCHGAVVVLQGGDVVVAECKFGPSINLQRDERPFTVSNSDVLHSVEGISLIWMILVKRMQPDLWTRHIIS